MEQHHTDEQQKHAEQELFEALLLIQSREEMHKFFKDLCTPQEIQAFIDRWKVCKLLHEGSLSYREIYDKTGVSLATISRVARFLNNEPHQGYQLVLDRIKKNIQK